MIMKIVLFPFSAFLPSFSLTASYSVLKMVVLYFSEVSVKFYHTQCHIYHVERNQYNFRTELLLAISQRMHLSLLCTHRYLLDDAAYSGLFKEMVFIRDFNLFIIVTLVVF
jgi:hypothetical protein